MFTWVIVAHSVDADVLALQAESFSKYLPEYLVHQILVVDNSDGDSRLPYTSIKAKYGKLASKVTFLPKSDFLLPTAFLGNGWFSQQVIKIAVAEKVETPLYVLLDAKNVMVYPFHCGYLIADNAKPRLFTSNYNSPHPLESYLTNALNYFELPLSNLSKFPQSITPYCMVREHAIKLMRYMEHRHKCVWWKPFLEHKLSEFFLYAAYLKRTLQLEETHELNGIRFSVIWEVNHAVNDVRWAIDTTRKSEYPFFSVHRRAIPLLDNEGRKAIADFWQERGLSGLWKS